MSPVAVSGVGGDTGLLDTLSAIDDCHEECMLLDEILGQMEGHMASLGEAQASGVLSFWSCFKARSTFFKRISGLSRGRRGLYEVTKANFSVNSTRSL